MGNSTFLGLFVYLIYLMISPYERELLFLIIFVDGCLSLFTEQLRIDSNKGVLDLLNNAF